MILKKMLANDKILSETGQCIDKSIKNLQGHVQKNIAAMRVQDRYLS
jgi:hypothetical protein